MVCTLPREPPPSPQASLKPRSAQLDFRPPQVPLLSFSGVPPLCDATFSILSCLGLPSDATSCFRQGGTLLRASSVRGRGTGDRKVRDWWWAISELSSMEKKLAEFKCNTNEAINLKLVRFPDDLEDENTTFHPEYTHQLFGDDESAFGYKGLQIFLYYIAGNLSPLFRLQYTSKVDEKFDCVQADDVESKIREIIPPVFCTNMDDFISLLEKEVNFRPFGTVLHTYSVHNEEAGEDITYQICKADMTCPGFREYHERLQTFLMWFIETASFIDVDDERWDYFLVQMLILPPFQGEGHGAQLLESVHRYYISSPKVMDITAEDPSENYVKLRDFVLVKLCQDLPCFSDEKLFQGFSKEMVMETQQKLKINKQHCRRIYEILRLRMTDMSDAEKARLYRLDIKRRLIGPFKKNQRELAKMKKCLNPEELTNQMNQIDLNMQHEQLEESYQQLISDYRRIIERLAQA
uniref:Histone acetyltransferase type B catalytic subunit n=1 Tax=Geotrypetes seraphini TaxID=260995 RepID=A0A6P8RD98_GEOSA|nr:histone acetyltransferase type B catalytic subunit isoform X5 [Geotrypetes seraphini]